MVEQNAAPAWLTGVWERKALWFGSAEPDHSTRVFYIQTPSLFADIRISATRSDASNVIGLEDLPDAKLEELLLQEGFAGTIESEDNLVTWQREIDFQPPTGIPDMGQCTLDEPTMIETGIHLDYTEKWQRIDDGNGQFLAMQIDRDGGGSANQILVVAGDHFLYVRGRKKGLGSAKSLYHLLQLRGVDRERLIRYLDCEFSYGFVRGGRTPWQIYLSTLPFKEGQPLIAPREMEVFPDLRVVHQHCRSQGSTAKQKWIVCENTLSNSGLTALLSAD